MKMSKRILFSALSLSLVLGQVPKAMAVSAQNPIAWNFLAGDYATEYDQEGMPQNLDDEPIRTFSDGFWSRLSTALPERTDLSKTNPEQLKDDTGANISLKEAGEVFITFLHEGAGYKNSLGYFTFDANNPPTSFADIQEKIVFPNVSFSDSGGNGRGLKSGQTVKLGAFPEGTSIGFVLASNGFDSETGVKSDMDREWLFSTLRQLNAEPTNDLRAHTVLLYDKETQHVVLGLEDILRTSASCDHDFNDVLFTVSSNPPEAINPESLASLETTQDKDNDGVVDTQDAFPEDAERAYLQHYPEVSNETKAYYTLAFEDNWPSQGDYDMNDLVVQYRYEQVTNAAGEVKDLNGFYKVKARGAELHNAFALEIPGTQRQDLEKATRSYGGNTESISPENEQAHLVFQVIDDATRFTADGCKFFNTESDCVRSDKEEITLAMTFKSALPTTKIGFAPYNPFIYRTDQRGLEVHLPNHPPTSKASVGRFGSKDDASNSASGQYYKTKSNLPWALNIPSAWNHPREHQPISKTYLGFENWAETSGQQNSDWFISQIYQPLLFKGVQ